MYKNTKTECISHGNEFEWGYVKRLNTEWMITDTLSFINSITKPGQFWPRRTKVATQGFTINIHSKGMTGINPHLQDSCQNVTAISPKSNEDTDFILNVGQSQFNFKCACKNTSKQWKGHDEKR